MKLEILFSREDVADLVSALYCAILEGAASSHEQEARWKMLREKLKHHGLKGEEVKEPQVTAIDLRNDFMHALELLARWPCWGTFLEESNNCGTKCVCGSGWARKRLAELEEKP